MLTVQATVKARCRDKPYLFPFCHLNEFPRSSWRPRMTASSGSCRQELRRLGTEGDEVRGSIHFMPLLYQQRLREQRMMKLGMKRMTAGAAATACKLLSM